MREATTIKEQLASWLILAPAPGANIIVCTSPFERHGAPRAPWLGFSAIHRWLEWTCLFMTDPWCCYIWCAMDPIQEMDEWWMGWVNLDESLGGSTTTLKSRLWGCWATRTGIGGEEPIMNINNERVEIGSENKSYHKPLHFIGGSQDITGHGILDDFGNETSLLSRRWWSHSQFFFHDQARWSPKKNPKSQVPETGGVWMMKLVTIVESCKC